MIETLLKNINKIIPLINLIIIFSFLITDYKKKISLKKFYDMSVSKNVIAVARPNKLIMFCEYGYWTGVSITGIFSLTVTSMWTCLAAEAMVGLSPQYLQNLE